MKKATFESLLTSMNEALEHAEGKRNLRTTTLPLPPAPLSGRAVKHVRATLHASQAVFARYLNVSTKLVQAWEGGRRVPEGPALVLLHIAAAQPGLIEAIRREAHDPQSRKTDAAGRSRRQGAGASSARRTIAAHP
jgi:putative transcriptional regulator